MDAVKVVLVYYISLIFNSNILLCQYSLHVRLQNRSLSRKSTLNFNLLVEDKSDLVTLKSVLSTISTYSVQFNFAHSVEQMVNNLSWSVVSYFLRFPAYLTLTSTYLLYSFGKNSWITTLSISVNLHFL